jgi:hypothetical protein
MNLGSDGPTAMKSTIVYRFIPSNFIIVTWSNIVLLCCR